MALQKSIDLYTGIALSAAYIVITDINIDYVNNFATVIVNIYKDSTAYSNGLPEVITNTHICSGSSFSTYFSESVLNATGNTALTKGYEWLLTLSLYSGATSV